MTMKWRLIAMTVSLAVFIVFAVPACTSEYYLREQHELGRNDAQRDFEYGEVELPRGCGTIAPGPDSSVREELGWREWRRGYRERIGELLQGEG